MPANSAKKARQRSRKTEIRKDAEKADLRNNIHYIGLFAPRDQYFLQEGAHYIASLREALIAASDEMDSEVEFLLHVAEMNFLLRLAAAGMLTFEPLSEQNRHIYLDIRHMLLLTKVAIMCSFQPMDLADDDSRELGLEDFVTQIAQELARIAYFQVKNRRRAGSADSTD